MEIKAENLFSSIAKKLIQKLTNELAVRYEFKYDGSGAFQSDNVIDEKAV